MGNRHPSIAPYETLRCADGLIAVACGNDGQFARLATVLGIPGLADDPAYLSNADRVTHREALADALEKRLAAEPGAHWVTALTAAGVPAGKVGTILDGVALAERLGLDPLVEVGDGFAEQVRHPVRWNGYRTAPATAPPALGEQDRALRAWLREPSDVAARPGQSN
jgi:crotonobetainyl-CoA:carnitine CoA-transferase CaiB-like acyl-CoA transferase